MPKFKSKRKKRFDTDRMHHEIGPDEFRMTLDYYGIEPDSHGKFLCPFHGDRKVGNCGIMTVNPAKGKCFACGKVFDSIDLVELYEGISEQWKAICFCWTDILGRQLLTYSENTTIPKLSPGDYLFLGLDGLALKPFDRGPILDVKGETFRNSPLPEGMEYFKDLSDVEADTCPYGCRLKAPTAEDIIRENPDFFFTMLENKANEKTVELLQLRQSALRQDNGPVKRLDYLTMVCEELLGKAYPGITQQVMPLVREKWEKDAKDGISRVKRIAGTIRDMEKYYNYRRPADSGPRYHTT